MTDFDATLTFLEKRRADEHSGDEQNGIKCQRDAWRNLSNATLSWLGGQFSAITRRLTPMTPCESLKFYGIRLMTPAPAMESDSVSPAAAWNQPGATGIMKLPGAGMPGLVAHR